MTRPSVAELSILAALLSIQDSIMWKGTPNQIENDEELVKRAIELWFAAEEEIDKRQCWDD